MTEFEDRQISDAFDEFATAAGPTVRAPGSTVARATVRRRRIVRAAVVGVVGALVLIVPAATAAVLVHGDHHHRNPDAVADDTPSPTPRRSAPASPDPSPSGSTSPSPSDSPAHAPDGRITLAQLTAQKVTVPAWRHYGDLRDSCGSGSRRLVGVGAPNDGGPGLPQLGVSRLAYADLDGDPSLETAALVSCQYGQAAIDQVVAFDRDSAGNIVTLGKVTEGVLWDVTGHGSGGVSVDVSDSMACCGTPKFMEEHQTRTYGWDSGSGSFVQTGGPTSFIGHQHPTRLTVTAKATWGVAHDGKRSGTVRVTVHNGGSYDAGPTVVWDDGYYRGRSLTDGPQTKHVARIPAGGDYHVTFAITTDSSYTDQDTSPIGAYELGGTTIGQDPVRAAYPLA